MDRKLKVRQIKGASKHITGRYLGPNIQGTSNYGTGKVLIGNMLSRAMQLKLCLMKHMQSLIVHYSVILANNQDLFSKSNSSLYCLQVCSIIFKINTLDSFINVKEPKYPFSLFSAFFEENNQNLDKIEGKNSILCIETEPIKIKPGKNNLLQPYVSSRHLLDDQNISNDT